MGRGEGGAPAASSVAPAHAAALRRAPSRAAASNPVFDQLTLSPQGLSGREVQKAIRALPTAGSDPAPVAGIAYHSARRATTTSIAQSGLRGSEYASPWASEGVGNPPGNHLFSSLLHCARYADAMRLHREGPRGDYVIWAVNIRGLELSDDPENRFLWRDEVTGAPDPYTYPEWRQVSVSYELPFPYRYLAPERIEPARVKLSRFVIKDVLAALSGPRS